MKKTRVSVASLAIFALILGLVASWSQAAQPQPQNVNQNAVVTVHEDDNDQNCTPEGATYQIWPSTLPVEYITYAVVEIPFDLTVQGWSTPLYRAISGVTWQNLDARPMLGAFFYNDYSWAHDQFGPGGIRGWEVQGKRSFSTGLASVNGLVSYQCLSFFGCPTEWESGPGPDSPPNFPKQSIYFGNDTGKRFTIAVRIGDQPLNQNAVVTVHEDDNDQNCTPEGATYQIWPSTLPVEYITYAVVEIPFDLTVQGWSTPLYRAISGVTWQNLDARPMLGAFFYNDYSWAHDQFGPGGIRGWEVQGKRSFSTGLASVNGLVSYQCLSFFGCPTEWESGPGPDSPPNFPKQSIYFGNDTGKRFTIAIWYGEQLPAETPTPTPTPTVTSSPTNTSTSTPTATATATVTHTMTATVTPTATSTSTATSTPTTISTPTSTPTPTTTPMPYRFYLPLILNSFPGAATTTTTPTSTTTPTFTSTPVPPATATQVPPYP